MNFPNPSTALAFVVVDELIRNGVVSAVASPGSRSTALVLALNGRPEIDLVMQLDERSAGFRALGSAVASGRPSVVLTTSGSAVANLAPAAVEAERSGVPLILLTADRPAEMVDRRANQTMDHFGVLGGFVRLRATLEAPTTEIDGNERWRRVVSDLARAARGGDLPPGPVHLNIAFSEPTLPVADDGRTSSPEYRFPVTAGGAAEQRAERTGRPQLPGLANFEGKHILAVAGQGDYDAVAFAAAARTSAIPVIATATSRARGEPGTLNAYNHWLLEGFPFGMKPDVVLVAGRVNPSDRLLSALRDVDEVVHVDRYGVFSDPFDTMTQSWRADPVDLLRSWPAPDPGWGVALGEVDSATRAALLAASEDAPGLTGPVVAQVIDSADWDALVVGSSLPIRDTESHLTRSGWVHSNRGVSGIDGFSSTVLGVAGQRTRTLGLVGDLSFLHDSNAFLTERVPPAVFVVVDNNGGGLFDVLPQAKFAADYERLFVTPHLRDIAELAAFHKLSFSEAHDRASLAEEVARGLGSTQATVVRARVDRAGDLEMRFALDESARQVLAELR